MFNGLPLSNFELLVVMLSSSIIWFSPWDNNITYKAILFNLVALIMLQMVIGQYYRNIGWDLCVIRHNNITDDSVCEQSIEKNDGKSSYTVSKIDYSGYSFPLYFMNGLDLNFTSSNQPDRNHLKYRLRATSFINPKKDTVLVATSNIKGAKVTLNGNEIEIGDQQKKIDIPTNQTSKIELVYTTNRQDQDFIKIDQNNSLTYTSENSVMSRTEIFYQIFKTIYNALVVLLVSIFMLLMIVNSNLKIRKNRVLLTVVMSVLVIEYIFYHSGRSFNYLAYIVNIFTILIIYWGLLARKKDNNKNLMLAVNMLISNSFVFASKLSVYSSLILFSGGNDALTHESFSRSVLFAKNFSEFLVAGENSPYYYQPLYRYILGLFHFITGESMWGSYLFQSLLMSVAIIVTLNFFIRLKNYLGAVMFSILIIFFSIGPEISPFYLTTNVFQQSFAYPLLIISIFITAKCFICNTQLYKYFLLGLLFSLGITTRFDLLPAYVVLSIVVIFINFKEKAVKHSLLFFCGLLILPMLILLRNYSVSGLFILLPTTSSEKNNLLPIFRDIIPQEDNLGGVRAILFILQHYMNNIGGLGQILFDNLKSGFIGTAVSRQILWLNVPLMVVLGMLSKNNKNKIGIVIMLFVLLSLIVPNLFYYIHNGLIMTIHLDYLIIVIISLCFGSFYLSPSYGKFIKKVGYYCELTDKKKLS